ncbi:hypothetical protein PHMEG_00022212 [Phytophthora megakarya]|uniref:DDE Tnp4 domain-containing protein n=1 Tax=Phytophthora megakarya TaxID=4795 RepID=A0A225VKZ0_9STRA|nr:hypothetical protein PHMEG_00022212 [Phytophthora megakarya]
MAIEGVFGLLKERFRILLKPLNERTAIASVRIIVDCFVLHNVLLTQKTPRQLPRKPKTTKKMKLKIRKSVEFKIINFVAN